MNEIVKEEFNDVPWEDSEIDLNLSRHTLKHACKHKDDDSAQETLMRMLLFERVQGRGGLAADRYYAIPIADYDESVIYRPQIVLTFTQDREQAKQQKRKSPVRATHGFRIMSETTETVTQANIDAWRNAINREFPKTYRFQKGRGKFTYSDKPNGYHLITQPYDEGEGRELVGKILGILGKTPDWEKATWSESGKNFGRKETVRILGKTQYLPERRPIAKVQLQRAELKLHGAMDDILLVERYV